MFKRILIVFVLVIITAAEIGFIVYRAQNTFNSEIYYNEAIHNNIEEDQNGRSFTAIEYAAKMFIKDIDFKF